MIDRELLAEYLEKLEEKIKEPILPREIDIPLIKNKAIAVVGPRRSGKTYIALDFIKKMIKECVYINLEHSCFKNANYKDIFNAISIIEEWKNIKAKIVLLDEVQRIERWETLVRSMLDMGYIVFVTGSSSKLLSKEIATQLRGRGIERLMLPLSFREYLRFKGIEIPKYFSISKKNKMLKLLENYLIKGAYPEVALNEGKEEEILRSYFTTILYLDFIERFELENISAARFIFEYCFQNFSKEISIRKIANFVSSMIGKDARDTVYRYVDKLPETLAVFFIERYNKSVYERISWPKKLYVCDLGLSTVIGFSEDIGKRMENVVFLELLRGLNKNPLKEIFYFKDSQQHEVDFLLKEGFKIKQLIQVTCASSFDEIDKREIRSLLKAGELFKEHKPELLVITLDYEDEKKIKWFGKEGKVKFVPLWKWLMNI